MRYLKLKKIILLIFIYPISFCIIRDKKSIVVGSYNNGFSDNSKYYYLWLLQNRNGLKVTWITGCDKTYKTMRALNLPVLKRWSIAGFIATLRAGTYIYSAYLRDINFYTSGRAKRVNLWHGVGIKEIDFSITSGPLKKQFNTSLFNLSRILFPDIFARPNLVLAPSLEMAKHFSKSFRIDQNHCHLNGMPRTSLHKVQMKTNEEENYLISGCVASHKWVYLPTWRDNKNSLPNDLLGNLKIIDKNLENRDTHLFIKLHPNEKINQVGSFNNITFIEPKFDIYPHLPEFDGLITDYSSVLYDFLSVGCDKIILHLYDFANYRSNSRNLIYDFEESVVGEITYKIDDFINALLLSKTVDIYKKRLVQERFIQYNECDFDKLTDAVLGLTYE